MSNFEYISHPYYILNYLLGLIYPLIKYIGMNTPHLQTKDSFGFSREYSVITGIITLIVIRFLRYFTNVKKFVNETIFYIKIGNALALFFIDVRLTCWYIFVCAIVWIIVKVPEYKGPSRIFYIASKEVFDEMLKYKNKLIKSADHYVFAIFYSNYNDNCKYVSNLYLIVYLYKYYRPKSCGLSYL